ncbi:hypothetical protein CEP52_016369 [Fusarium oligoseptatum]|uniref:Uncharacterized protein n=2 Tax=Fusarium solani species complex TaxID=232080 RepID=A0A428S4A0_9HYPO|nr:hypothetical protein CEP51_007455 [Fusarium floridanum]RSL84689.1 hypothetical protein CEP52_016369 [Fusarium oligoseptatum]
MFSRQTLLALLSLSGSPVLADFLGPRYPPPADLTSKDSHVIAGWENLTETLQGYLKIGPEEDPVLSTLKNITFSVGLFSTRDDGAASKYQFHYNSPKTKEAKYGTKKVDGDTIYGIASITKLFTVYSALMNLDPVDWERPLTYFFPQLADTAKKARDNPTEHIQWDKITPLALANQIGGVPRDGWPLFTGGEKDFSDILTLGLPPLNPQTDPQMSSMSCNNVTDPNITSCADDYNNYVESQEQRPPTFLPWSSPAYANTGFILLGAILQNITGKSLDEQFSGDIFDPLGMSRTSTQAPSKDKWDNAVIPVNNDTELEIYYLMSPDPAKSSGTLLSTINDLTKFGTSILNHTLLPGDVTRKWMKPHSHTTRLDYSVGGPWEIPRYVHPETGLVIDLYTKSGDAGLYSSFLVLVPEFEIGFSILAATSEASLRSLVAGKIGDAVVNALMPALLEQAASEAERNYGGTYVSTTEGLNSSITITRNKTEGAPPGLTISRFISNGTDYLLAESSAGGKPNNPDTTPNRLVPTVIDEKSGRVAMRALTAVDAPKPSKGTISSLLSADWATVGSVTYGALDMGLYIFDVDDDGKAMEVSPVAFRTTLKRKD